MPTYNYRCNACDTTFEAFHGMNEKYPDCEECGGATTRLPSAPAIHGAMAHGRDAAVNSLPKCGAGCRCCP